MPAIITREAAVATVADLTTIPAYIAGSVVDTLAARSVWQAFGDDSDFISWQKQQIENSHLLEHGVDWVRGNDGSLRITALAVLMCAGSLGWDSNGWEAAACAIKRSLSARVDPDMSSFDHFHGYNQLDRGDRSLCNTAAFDGGLRHRDIERARQKFIWMRLHGHQIPQRGEE